MLAEVSSGQMPQAAKAKANKHERLGRLVCSPVVCGTSVNNDEGCFVEKSFQQSAWCLPRHNVRQGASIEATRRQTRNSGIEEIQS